MTSETYTSIKKDKLYAHGVVFIKRLRKAGIPLKHIYTTDWHSASFLVVIKHPLRPWNGSESKEYIQLSDRSVFYAVTWYDKERNK